MTEQDFKDLLVWYIKHVEANEGVTTLGFIDLEDFEKIGLSLDKAEFLLDALKETGLDC